MSPLSQDPEKRANSLENLSKGLMKKGDPPRQKHLRELPSREQIVAKYVAELHQRQPGEPSPYELQLAERRGVIDWLNERENLGYLKTYTRSNTAATAGRIKRAMDLTKLSADLAEQQERATQERVRAASKPNAGQPIRPVKTADRAIAVAKVIAAAGQAGTSAEARRLGKLLAEQLERDEKDRIAVQTELADLPTTTDRGARP